MATTSHGIEFLDFPQPTITSFDMAMPSDSTGAEYLVEIVKLQPLQEILRFDLVVKPHIQWIIKPHRSVVI